MTSIAITRVTALFLVLALIAGCSSGNRLLRQYESDPSTVAVIDGRPVSMAEFERQYAKTVGGRSEAAADSVAEYQDFLERWVDFRLKVMSAREAGLDKDSSLVAELSGYRDQFARPFLMDREVTDPLVRALYDKRQQMVDASHILIRVDRAAAPDDTLRAYRLLSAIRDSILAGADFGEMAVRHSQDPSASSDTRGPGYKGRLGFVRGGRLVPEFEDVAFTIEKGVVSPVFRTQFGYHILRVNERKRAAEDIRISHIMVTPKSPEDSAAAWEKIRAVHDSLEAGVDFAELAKRNSDDAGSARNGGDIGFVAVDGRLVPAIKEAAFALEEIGDYTGPIETQFGLHVVKLTERKQAQSIDDAYEDLRRQVARSPQMEARQNEFALEIMQDYGYTVDSVAVLGLFGEISADSALALVAGEHLESNQPATAIASMGGHDYSHADFIDWVHSNPPAPARNLNDFVDRIIDGFLVDNAIALKLARLEDENEEFRQTMADFVDGLLLFRVMDDSVWTQAASDSVTLRRKYDAEPDRYVYPDRHRLVSIYSRTKSVADSANTMLMSGSDIEGVLTALSDTTTTRIRVDTTFVEGPTNSVFDRALELNEGEHTGVLSYNRGWTVIMNAGIEPSRTKTFEEARTEIVSEYQDELEKRLVQRLRNRYSVVTYPAKVAAAFDEEPAAGDEILSEAN